MIIGAIIAVALGLLLAVFGHRLARIAMTLWAACAGFLIGMIAFNLMVAAGVASASVSPLLLGGVVAALFAGLAYFSYVVAVLVGLGSIGWTLGSVIAPSISGSVPVQLVIAAGFGVAMAAGGVAFDLPRNLMIVGTSALGAGGVVAGVRTMVENYDWLSLSSWVSAGPPPLIWIVAAGVLVAAGIVLQLRQHSEESLRAAY